jgi:hypothetical protein
MIWVWGNSHAHFFTDSTPSQYGEGEKQNEHFRSFSLGPVIAYNFIVHHFPTMIQWVNQLPITENDYILLNIGEVDCRWHLPKQAEIQRRDVLELTRECVDRFFQAHLILKEAGYQVIGWGGHPSTTRGHDDNPNEPVYGDCLSRNKITLEWSQHLERKCKENDLRFVSIVEELINVDGLTKMEYYKDYCHLDSKKLLPLVIEKFKELKLL